METPLSPPRAVGTQATIPLVLIELAKQGFEMEVEARRAQAVSRDLLKGFLRVFKGFCMSFLARFTGVIAVIDGLQEVREFSGGVVEGL